MDGRRFDDLSRSFGRALSRRRAVAGAIGLATAGLAVAGDASAVVRRTCRPLNASCLRGRDCCSSACVTRRTAPRNRRNRCVCPEGLLACGTTCVDPMTDKNNCGSCGNVCPGTCVSGVCTCKGVTCEIDEAGGWEQCGIDTETCEVIDSCSVIGANPQLTTCETHADCADFDDRCGVDGQVCRCSTGMGLTVGGFYEMPAPGCVVVVPQLVPGACAGCTVENSYPACVLTTTGDSVSYCQGGLSPNNATTNWQGQTPSEQTIGCQTDADCSQNCTNPADDCFCTLGGKSTGTFQTWEEAYGIQRACFAVAYC